MAGLDPVRSTESAVFKNESAVIAFYISWIIQELYELLSSLLVSFLIEQSLIYVHIHMEKETRENPKNADTEC